MIHPTDAKLLAGIADALRDTVLPELARGTAARKQLQAAIEILRRMAFALPASAEALAADNEDMAGVLKQASVIMRRSLPVPNSQDPAERNIALQTALAEIQENAPAEVERLLAALYTRVTDRALALMPPPLARTPKGAA